jgi:RNA-directed DNA polymerase
MPAEASTVGDLASGLGVNTAVLTDLLEFPYQHYRRLPKTKVTGGVRFLLVPDSSLRRVQGRILARLLSGLPQHPCSHCCTGRSIITGARAHLGNKFVSVCDLENCFPSVTPQQVSAALHLAGINPAFIDALVSLCTHRRQLPQGAPTSTALLNAVLYGLDIRLNAAAQRQGITYTRWVDDLAFSANHPLKAFLRKPVRQFVSDAGFHISHGKTRHWGPRQIPTITGVEITSSAGPSRSLVRTVERSIGAARAGVRVGPKGLRTLLGRIAWIHATRPKTATKLYNALAEAIPDAIVPTRS